MKKHFFILLFAIGNGYAEGQIVPSNCVAADSIVAKYTDDADRLALRKIYRQNLIYKDSIQIPDSHSDTILNALIAVYNATILPARDSVINLFNIHTFPYTALNSFYIAADSNLSWMKQLRLQKIATVQPIIDSLLTKFHFTMDRYYEYGHNFEYHLASFESDSNYNLKPLVNLIAEISGVYYAEPDSYGGDGYNISDSVNSDHVELIYSYGWGDCIAGCIYRRFWKFNVYFDCSVELVESYGDLLPNVGIRNIISQGISAFPIPFDENMSVRGISGPFNFSFIDLYGRTILSGKSASGRIENLDALISGVYTLILWSDKRSKTLRVVKE